MPRIVKWPSNLLDKPKTYRSYDFVYITYGEGEKTWDVYIEREEAQLLFRLQQFCDINCPAPRDRKQIEEIFREWGTFKYQEGSRDEARSLSYEEFPR